MGLFWHICGYDIALPTGAAFCAAICNPMVEARDKISILYSRLDVWIVLPVRSLIKPWLCIKAAFFISFNIPLSNIIYILWCISKMNINVFFCYEIPIYFFL